MRKTPLKDMEPGFYFHFGIKNGVKHILKSYDLKSKNVERKMLQIIVNVDRIPIAKSSGSQFWPILGMLTNVHCAMNKPFMIGIFHGSSKPKDPNDFMKDFTEEMQALQISGVLLDGHQYKLELKGLVCDAPAKAFILCTKNHTGYCSCTKCVEEGEWEGRVVFLNESAPLRTDASFREKIQEDYHTGTTILENLNIDMVKSFPLDYMHLICLGIMRKLIWVWIRGPLKTRLQARILERFRSYLLRYRNIFQMTLLESQDFK